MKRALVLAVDYGQKWPLNDIMSSDPRPDWDSIISSDLRARLIAWARFFNDHMDWETGLFGVKSDGLGSIVRASACCRPSRIKRAQN